MTGLGVGKDVVDYFILVFDVVCIIRWMRSTLVLSMSHLGRYHEELAGKELASR